MRVSVSVRVLRVDWVSGVRTCKREHKLVQHYILTARTFLTIVADQVQASKLDSQSGEKDIKEEEVLVSEIRPELRPAHLPPSIPCGRSVGTLTAKCGDMSLDLA